MDFIKGFLIKLVITITILWIVFGLFLNVPIPNVLTISVVLTVIAFIGDSLFLPNLKKQVAIIGDLILSFTIISILGYFFIEKSLPLVLPSLISAIIISIGEILFHKYMMKYILNNRFSISQQSKKAKEIYRLKTEFGSELEVDSIADAKNKR